MSMELEVRKLREEFHRRIVEDIKTRLDLTYAEIARKHEVSPDLVFNLARLNNCRRRADKPANALSRES